MALLFALAVGIAAATGIIPGGFSNPVLYGQTSSDYGCQLFAQDYYFGEYRYTVGVCYVNTPDGWMEREAARAHWINNGGKP